MEWEILAPLIEKGLDVIVTVASNTDLVTKAANAIKNIVSNPNPTQADIDATEADLDAMLDEFNAPLP